VRCQRGADGYVSRNFSQICETPLRGRGQAFFCPTPPQKSNFQNAARRRRNNKQKT
jgi:hypothetical protein